MPDTTWGKFNETAKAFAKLVKEAKSIEGSGQYEIKVDGITETFRLKRGKDRVNQIHLHHGEPLVVHIPQEDDEDGDGTWYVLSVKWQISYALKNPDSRQHTVHALDCFMFPSSQLTSPDEVDPSKLPQALADAIRESREDQIVRAVRAIRRARVVSATQFEDAADTASDALDLPVPKELVT